MSNYPSLLFTRVSNGASILTSPFRQIQTAIVQIQQDMVNARVSVSTLATYISKSITASGQFVYASHGALLAVTAGNHHGQDHASSHRGTDSVIGSNAKDGLITSDGYNILASTIQSASVNKWVGSGSYSGNEATTRLITTGFAPFFVMIGQASQGGRGFASYAEGILGATNAFWHLHESPTNLHHRVAVTNLIRLSSNGFFVASIFNVSNYYLYHYVAQGGSA